MKKASIVIGMQFGDEGKGQCVDWLCEKTNADLVVRFGGGHQCGHNVVRNGYRHNFASFGSGSLLGVPTHVGPDCIIEWNAMRREHDALVAAGFNPVITVDPSCLVTTPFHAVMNQVKHEMNGHGTCGVGIGETREYWLKYGRDAIFAGDNKNDVRDKVRLMRYRMHEELRSMPIGADEYNKFTSLSEYKIANMHRSVDCGLKSIIGMTPTEGVLCDVEHVVFEGHQGVLLDESFGFHPHTTWSDTTARKAIELCHEHDIEYKVFGCLRAVMSRHGNGPFPTYDSSIPFSDPGNQWNPGQGKMRFGWLDMSLLRYANSLSPVDYTVISWVDKAEELRQLLVSDSYQWNGILKTPFCLEDQEKLTEQVRDHDNFSLPLLTRCSISDVLERVELIAPIAAIGRSADKRIDTGVVK